MREVTECHTHQSGWEEKDRGGDEHLREQHPCHVIAQGGAQMPIKFATLRCGKHPCRARGRRAAQQLPSAPPRSKAVAGRGPERSPEKKYGEHSSIGVNGVF